MNCNQRKSSGLIGWHWEGQFIIKLMFYKVDESLYSQNMPNDSQH